MAGYSPAVVVGCIALQLRRPVIVVHILIGEHRIRTAVENFRRNIREIRAAKYAVFIPICH